MKTTQHSLLDESTVDLSIVVLVTLQGSTQDDGTNPLKEQAEERDEECFTCITAH